MPSQSKSRVSGAHPATADDLPVQDPKVTPIKTPLEALPSQEISSRLSSEQYGLLFKNMPLGIMEENYSAVKQEIDRLLADGVDDLAQYFLDHPDRLMDLVNRVEFVNANKALVELRGADSVETVLQDETDVESWWSDEWIGFYASEFPQLLKSNAYFGIEMGDTKVDGSPYVSRTSTFVVAGFEDTWEQVVSIHEDITDRVQVERQIREAQHELERQVQERTRELQDSEALLTQGAEMVGLGYAVRDDEAGKYLTVSDEFARIFGYTRAEFLARFDDPEKECELIFPADVDRFIAARLDDASPGSETEITVRIMRRDGEIRHLMHACKQACAASGERPQSLVTIRDITERKRVEEALEHSYALYRQAEYMGNMGHWSWDHLGYRMTSCSEQLARIYEMTVPEAIAYFSSFEAKMSRIHPEDRDRYRQALKEANRTRQGLDIEYRILTLSGMVRHICLRSERVYDAQGTLVRSFGTVQDISERVHTEQELLTQSQITSHMAEGAMLVKAIDATIVYTNPAFDSIFGYARGELLGQHVSRLNAVTDISPQQATENLISELDRHGKWRGEICNVKKDGTVFWCSVNMSVFEHSEFGQVWVSVNSDTTERRQAEKKLSYQASHDQLTGLINRREFEHRAKRLIASTHRCGGEHALCFLDLDQFKIVNDSCGHTAGDELLKQLARVLGKTVRRRDTLARLGGDEFGVLMEHCTLEQAQRAADTLVEQVADFQFAWQGQFFRIGVSAGLVGISETTANLTELLQQADAACYMAKDLGRNRIHVYRPEDSELARRHGEMQWVARIDQALEENRFTLYAQEILPLDGPGARHFELLLRMIDCEGNIVNPRAFLPAAERYDFIDKLDSWVIREALSLMRDNPEFVAASHLIAINLSGRSLGNKRFLSCLIERMEEYRIDASKICFEITETAAISNLVVATTFISQLREQGCRFALDDFGSGLSSFAYLKSLDVDYLKIDGMFVKDMVDDPIDHAMVKSINDIGHVMGKKTIAEFVESDAIKAELIKLGVDCVQGYGIQKPRPFSEVLKESDDSRCN